MRSITKALVTATALSAVAFTATACAITTDPHPATTAAQKSATGKKPAVKAQAAKELPKETPGQENARRTAEGYIDMSAFSRKGLIEQLSYEGYSKKDAAYAAGAVHANWNDQAAKAAKAYLDQSGFSRSGLIDQLKFEGYTPQQAKHGVTKAGL